MSVQALSEQDFQQKVLQAQGKIVVDFFATWCGPCKMLAPILEQLADEHADVTFYKVDVDEAPALSAEWGVMSVPTVFIFENGVEKTHFIGAKPKAEIAALL